MSTDFYMESEDEFRGSPGFNEESFNKDGGVSMAHQQPLNKFEPLLSLTQSLEEARKLNHELHTLLHLKNEELYKKHHYIDRLNAHSLWLQEVNQNLTCQIQELSWHARQLETKINDLEKSPIWRIAIPLRFFSKMRAKIARNVRTIPLKLKRYLRLLFIHTILYLRCRPKLKQFAIKIASCFPRIKSRLIAHVPQKNQAVSEPPKSPFAIENLSTRAKTVYNQLLATSEDGNKDF